jgi:hypothetical protein
LVVRVGLIFVPITLINLIFILNSVFFLVMAYTTKVTVASIFLLVVFIFHTMWFLMRLCFLFMVPHLLLFHLHQCHLVLFLLLFRCPLPPQIHALQIPLVPHLHLPWTLPHSTPLLVLPPARRHPMRTRSQNAIHKPKPLPTDFIPKPPPKAFSTSTGPLEVEPTCFTLTSKSPHWREAMNAEFIALMRNGTWSLVPCKPTLNLVGCKWVFKIKRKPDGSIEKYKARLVAKGFHQQPGVDYGDTFNLVVKPTTVRIVLSLVVSSNWCIK